MLISKTENEEQGETAVDSTQPVCPNCGAARESILEQVPSPASFIISFVSLFYFGIWCIFIIPLVFQSTKMIIKRCYYCHQELEKRKYFQLPNINDQVLQFRFGNCIVVVSRKYALILLAIIISLFFYFEYFVEQEHPQIEANVYANKSWVDFLQFCGKFQFVDNSLKARHQFETHFKNKIVSWKGDFIQTKPNHDPNFHFNYWVYLKMDPTESTDELPDIIIGVTESQYSISTFQKLEKGKPIHFEAKFLFLGSEYNFHILELKHLTVIHLMLIIKQQLIYIIKLYHLKMWKISNAFINSPQIWTKYNYQREQNQLIKLNIQFICTVPIKIMKLSKSQIKSNRLMIFSEMWKQQQKNKSKQRIRARILKIQSQLIRNWRWRKRMKLQMNRMGRNNSLILRLSTQKQMNQQEKRYSQRTQALQMESLILIAAQPLRIEDQIFNKLYTSQSCCLLNH